MGNISRGSGIWSGTYTGLIGIKTSLDTKHNTGAGETTEDSLKIKGFCKDCFKNMRQQADIQQGNHTSYQHINHAHERHQSGGNTDNTPTAAKDAPANHYSQNTADYPRGRLCIIEAKAREGGLEVVGTQHIKAYTIGENQGKCKNHRNKSVL